jgi:hypothetical protein
MSEIPTIIEFLESTGAQLRLFDMGRRVVKLSREEFLKFERNEIPYPLPLQQQAWFGILFQEQEKEAEPFIWFLRLPLDEVGRLTTAARDDFLHRLLERAGENLLASKEGRQLENALKDNPYCFKPRDDRMAIFHAKASHGMKQPASQYYSHAQKYFGGELGWDQWSFVGYQGIADMAARLDEGDNSDILAAAIPLLPARPFEALCHCLENEEIGLPIAEAIFKRMQQSLEETAPDLTIISAAIRGVALTRSKSTREQLIQTILDHPCSSSPDVLAAISGRTWEPLADARFSLPFLERLAQNSAGQDFFNQCLSDLLYLPGMREPLLKTLRNPARSEQLAQAMGSLFQSVGKTD